MDTVANTTLLFDAPLFYSKLDKVELKMRPSLIEHKLFCGCYIFGFVKVFTACEMHAYSLNKRSSYIDISECGIIECDVEFRAILQAQASTTGPSMLSGLGSKV